MKVRLFIICLLTAAVLAAICVPGLLQGLVPQAVLDAASLDDFPLLNTCGRIARSLTDTIRGRRPLDASIFEGALDQTFWDQLVSLVMVSALSIPVSLLLGFYSVPTALYRLFSQGAVICFFEPVQRYACLAAIPACIFQAADRRSDQTVYQ